MWHVSQGHERFFGGGTGRNFVMYCLDGEKEEDSEGEGKDIV